MSVTCGFYNSIDHDRRYDAIQVSSIFDGIIRDGVYQHIGTALMVKAAQDMMIHVGIGRAWFNHTWTLNDALLPLIVPLSEVILNRIDAVVLEVDAREEIRSNSIKIVKGTPSSNPVRPTMVKTNDRWQYPLAYIQVNAGVTSIRQANITNCVGTSECPFVTAPLEKMDIDALIAQWGDQWKEFYENQTADMEATNLFWKEQWSRWYHAKTAEIEAAYESWEQQWEDWFNQQTSDMTATNSFWKQQWHNWFHSYVNSNTEEMAEWREENRVLFNTWFSQMQATLSGDAAGNLANQVFELQNRTKLLEQFSDELATEFTVCHKLWDTGYRTYDNVLDASGKALLDNDLDPVIGRTLSSELVLDSNGDPIDARVIFQIK